MIQWIQLQSQTEQPNSVAIISTFINKELAETTLKNKHMCRLLQLEKKTIDDRKTVGLSKEVIQMH